jgi:hypothetical protein
MRYPSCESLAGRISFLVWRQYLPEGAERAEPAGGGPGMPWFQSILPFPQPAARQAASETGCFFFSPVNRSITKYSEAAAG